MNNITLINLAGFMAKTNWTFITNHAAVLALLNREGKLTARELGIALDITERSVIRIIKDLEMDGYITKYKEGRENRYTINNDLPLRRKNQRDINVRALLQLISRQK